MTYMEGTNMTGANGWGKPHRRPAKSCAGRSQALAWLKMTARSDLIRPNPTKSGLPLPVEQLLGLHAARVGAGAFG